ncbi:MAG: stage II sporulation protein R [Lachnospiraceae bacterium]|nr:stage II sporulation protein R [Lachnospiraceae bacterium]
MPFLKGGNVSLEERYFPVKSYGDLVFPAGNYKALCVEIGEAKGRNWWCVLFPSLCFVDETYAVVPDSSKEKLKETLSDEEYESLEQNKEEKGFFTHLAIYDWFCRKTGR